MASGASVLDVVHATPMEAHPGVLHHDIGVDSASEGVRRDRLGEALQLVT